MLLQKNRNVLLQKNRTLLSQKNRNVVVEGRAEKTEEVDEEGAAVMRVYCFREFTLLAAECCGLFIIRECYSIARLLSIHKMKLFIHNITGELQCQLSDSHASGMDLSSSASFGRADARPRGDMACGLFVS